jgi:hypothetical protein
VFLTFAIGESKSHLFVLEATGSPGVGFSYFPLAIGRRDLEREVKALRDLVGGPEIPLAEARLRGRHLYDLHPPRPALLARAERL